MKPTQKNPTAAFDPRQEDPRMMMRGLSRDEFTARDLLEVPLCERDTDLFASSSMDMLILNRELICRNGIAALEGMALCGRHGLKPPDWLVESFCSNLARFQTYGAASLDEAFDVPPLTNKRRTKLARDRELISRIDLLLTQAMQANPTRPIDVSLFEEIGEMVNIKATLCEELYRKGLRNGRGDLKDYKELLRYAQNLRK